MDWVMFLLALVVTGLVTSFSDWLFFGVIFHAAYRETPGIWRGTNERTKIVWSTLLAIAGAGAYFLVLHHLHVQHLFGAMHAALAVWVAAPLPITITNTLYVNYAPRLAVSHSLGWLARLVIAGAVYVYMVAAWI
jgi:hypothetical protein